MQNSDERVSAIIKNKKLKLSWLPYIIFASAVATTLIAIFMLSGWVEASGLHHAVQHVMIFVSGAAAGGSFLSVLKIKKEQQS